MIFLSAYDLLLELSCRLEQRQSISDDDYRVTEGRVIVDSNIDNDDNLACCETNVHVSSVITYYILSLSLQARLRMMIIDC